MNLADVCGRLQEFDRESTIYAREPWSPTSEAIVTVEPDHGGRPEAARRAGMRYFIEVSIALELLDGWLSTLTVPPTAAARVRRLIEFAMPDAPLLTAARTADSDPTGCHSVLLERAGGHVATTARRCK